MNGAPHLLFGRLSGSLIVIIAVSDYRLFPCIVIVLR